jgi:uncharacterized protein YfaS (alpha-2-macroglobulin family)
MLVVVIILLAVTVCGLAAVTLYALRLPQAIAEQDTLIAGQSQLIPGAPGAIQIQVQRHDDGAPIAGAEVEVAMQPRGGGAARVLYTGTTDVSGHVSAGFIVPDVASPDQRSWSKPARAGRDTLQQAVTVERDFKVLLSTDKPIYQPGQQILIRALALGA